MRRHAAAKDRRHGTASVEFAVCLPLMCLILTGLWEVGRITQVAEVMWDSAREAARDASLGQDNLQTVTTNLLTYLQEEVAQKLSVRRGNDCRITAFVCQPDVRLGYAST